MKIDIEDIEHALRQRNDVPPQVVTDILKDLQAAAKEAADAAKEEKEAAGAPPKPYPVLLATAGGPDAPLEAENTPFFIIEPLEGIAHTEVLELVHKAIVAYNNNLLAKRGKKRKKHKRQLVENIGEAVEQIPATIFKQFGLKVRHRQPAICLPVSNDLDRSLIDKFTAPEEDAGDSNLTVIVE